MKLRDLDAEFLKRVDDRSSRRVDSLAEADGIMFLCPKCFAEKGSNVGVHSVICWFVGKVADYIDPKPGLWIPAGTGIDDLTFVGPGAASILLPSPSKRADESVNGVILKGGCGWHGFIKNGEAA